MKKLFGLGPMWVLFGLAFVVRAVTAAFQHQPYTLDEAYSYVNAVTLLQGGGLREFFVWNYLNLPESLPQASHLYWMPLTSFIAAGSMALFGESYTAAQVGFVLLAALWPPFGYYVAYQVSGQARYGWAVGLLLVFSGFYLPMWTAVDNFTPFALAGSVALYATWQYLSPSKGERYRWAFVAGVMAGLGHLSRADGPLLLGVFALFALSHHQSIYAYLSRFLPLKRGQSQPLTAAQVLGGLVLAGSGYLLIMAPWFWRNWLTVGAILPPGGTKTIWLKDYNDIFSYTKDLSLTTYLTWGWAAILESKLWASWLNLQTLMAVIGLVVAFPLALVGWWQQRTHPLLQISGVYLLLLWLAMTLVFTFPGVRGALFHSGGAVLPFVYLAAVYGLDASIQAIARRRRSWHARTAQPVFTVGLIGFGVLISLFVSLERLPAWNSVYQTYPHFLADYLEPNSTVFVGNPPAFIYHGGYKALPLPNEPLEQLFPLAERYHVTYLIIDQHHPAPLSQLYQPEFQHPNLSRLAVLSDADGQASYLYRLNPVTAEGQTP